MRATLWCHSVTENGGLQKLYYWRRVQAPGPDRLTETHHGERCCYDFKVKLDCINACSTKYLVVVIPCLHVRRYTGRRVYF